MDLQWLVGERAEHEEIAGAAVSALGTRAAVYRGPFDAAPDARIRFVFAADLASYVASLPPGERARRCERTILVNAERSEVLELLEQHGLGGAIECEEPDAWTAYDARMFIRKETIDPARGERIGGPGRESEHYVLWTHRNVNTNTCRLADLVRECAAACSRFATRFDELVLSADDARRHELPAVGMRMIIGRTGLLAHRFPRPGVYLQLSGPPGGVVGVEISACTDASPLELARQLFADLPGPVPTFGDVEQVQLAGALREAVACDLGSPTPFARRACCVVKVAHRSGSALVRFSGGLAPGVPLSCAAVLANQALRIIASSFTLEEG